MSFRKHAKLEILEVKGTRGRQRTASLDKLADSSDYHDYRTDDGYMYVRVRAISSRVNKNHDGWPSEELQKAYRTFIGKPIFIDHNNHDPKRARGVVVDAKLHVEDTKKAAALDPYYASAPTAHTPPTWIELLLEVDAKKFPRLAKAVVSKDIDSVSMGANVERSKCSHCGNWARNPDEFCDHVRSKGASFDYVDEHGRKTSKKSYEDCYDIGFFEISFVFDPADETALVSDIKHEGEKVAKTAAPSFNPQPQGRPRNDVPQDDMLVAPSDINTLRQERMCPICGSDMEDGVCEVCNYEEPPEGLDNPDLSKAKQEDDAAQQQVIQQQPQPSAVAASTNSVAATSSVTSDTERKVASNKQPILPASRPTSDRPTDTKVVRDSSRPVESKNEETTMSQKVADGAKPHGTDKGTGPDKRVPVDGVGGVMPEDYKPDARVEVDQKGGMPTGNPLNDPEHQKVDSKSDIERLHTDTWSGTDGQTSPVQGEAFPKASAEHDTSGILNSGPDKTINVEKPLMPEGVVGPGTEQWTGTKGQADPVTDKVDPNIDVRKVRTHIVRAMKLAETEVNLGLTEPDDKFDRASQLEDETAEALDAREETLSRVKTAGLRPVVSKTAATRVPSMGRRVASVAPATSTDTDDSALFM